MQTLVRGLRPLLVTSLALGAGCAGTQEYAARGGFADVQRPRAAREEPPGLDGSLQAYVAAAMLRSPELEASYERWRAAVLRIAPRRRLPDPTIGYAYFIRSVETRVGPQQHRLSIMQSFPWPGRLTSGSDAQAAMARAEQRRFEARALAVAERVADAYWRLWLVHRAHQIQLDQEAVLESLVESVRARVEVGNATLADLGQIQLRLERLRDHREQHHLAMRTASAQLVAAMGAPPGTETPVAPAPPEVALPAAEPETLLAQTLEHPRIHTYAHLAEANEELADAESAAGLPSFTVGADWIVVGEAAMPGVQDSGKDAVMVSLSVTVPLWRGAYSDAEDAARAEAQALRAEAEDAEQRAAAELVEALAAVQDSHRRVRLYRDTLLPQAETVYGSTLGGYQTGRGGIADTLLAVRELLDLQLELERALAEHGAAWARLDHVVGTEVERRVERRDE